MLSCGIDGQARESSMWMKAKRAVGRAKAALTVWSAVWIMSFLATPSAGLADDVRVAVAANFTRAAQEIGRVFETETGHQALFSFGSTGLLYAQILQGAPFDVFLAADQDRPRRIVDEGMGVEDRFFTYAAGKIVLYSARTGFVMGEDTLRSGDFTRLAIAHPRTAPYGAAAVQALEALSVYEALQPKTVYGTNIAQTYQFVETGNAELGFVALAQIVHHKDGSRWLVPEGLHEPIAQGAVMLESGLGRPAAEAFLAFLKSPTGRGVIRRHGYDTPDQSGG